MRIPAQSEPRMSPGGPRRHQVPDMRLALSKLRPFQRPSVLFSQKTETGTFSHRFGQGGYGWRRPKARVKRIRLRQGFRRRCQLPPSPGYGGTRWRDKPARRGETQSKTDMLPTTDGPRAAATGAGRAGGHGFLTRKTGDRQDACPTLKTRDFGKARAAFQPAR